MDEQGTFALEQPENYSYQYFPVAGEKGIKSALTPVFGGDSKRSQNEFLLEPVSVENPHNNRSTRNFWCHIEGMGNWSVTGASAEAEAARFTEKQEKSCMTAGLMWQSVTRVCEKYQMEAKVTSFVPTAHDVEIMQVELTNRGTAQAAFVPVAAVPIYGRSADNLRDHRHVTSLLHRIRTREEGVVVTPALSFDERGHRVNKVSYFVCGMTGDGKAPEAFFPTAALFLGEGGSYTAPRAVMENAEGVPAGTSIDGSEAVGGLKFARTVLEPGEKVSFHIVMGMTEEPETIAEVTEAYRTAQKVETAFAETRESWQEKVNIRYQTGNKAFDGFMRWVSFQPTLRRIYGCSFLPHHDYGRGGRGWRDLWQDCLALLLMNPDGVRRMLLDNFGGVRMDGTNATIIGAKQGEFIADRNNITRVWMDHGVWPFMTANLTEKADWMAGHIRMTEWVKDKKGNGWFNGYYDNHGRQVEGEHEKGVRMMLTGQVFAIMGGTATEEQIRSIVKSADAYLYEEKIGGYRLNTDFHELKTDLGRMFGFAYGEKENGAVFSHMAVMYANALYRRGFAKEGYKALQALADAALHFETSRIYPGIPEYFNNEGRGMYHYLTGAASWYMLTFITEVFGVRGKAGDLEISPALMRKQFDESGTAGLELPFAGKRFRVTVKNPDRLECGDYRIESAWVDGQPLALSCEECRVQTGDTGMAGNACSRKRADTVTVLLARADIMQLADKVHEIEILLGKGEDGQQ